LQTIEAVRNHQNHHFYTFQDGIFTAVQNKQNQHFNKSKIWHLTILRAKRLNRVDKNDNTELLREKIEDTERKINLKRVISTGLFRLKQVAIETVHFIGFILLDKILLKNDLIFKPTIPLVCLFVFSVVLWDLCGYPFFVAKIYF
jgi:hypothetical protein